MTQHHGISPTLFFFNWQQIGASYARRHIKFAEILRNLTRRLRAACPERIVEGKRRVSTAASALPDLLRITEACLAGAVAILFLLALCMLAWAAMLAIAFLAGAAAFIRAISAAGKPAAPHPQDPDLSVARAACAAGYLSLSDYLDLRTPEAPEHGGTTRGHTGVAPPVQGRAAADLLAGVCAAARFRLFPGSSPGTSPFDAGHA